MMVTIVPLTSRAVANSEIVKRTPPSPAIITTGSFGAATFAPIPIGSAGPSVPSPYGASQRDGVDHGV